jgi:hypothetical protein
MTKAPVAAGIDGSPAGRQRSVGRPQRLPPAVPDSGLVHAFVWPQFPVPLGPSDVAPSLRAAADKIVRESVELAQKLEPGVPVEGTREDGFPPKAIRSTANARPAAVVTRIGSRSPSGSITGAGRWRRCGAVWWSWSCPFTWIGQSDRVAAAAPAGRARRHAWGCRRACVAGTDACCVFLSSSGGWRCGSRCCQSRSRRPFMSEDS